MTESDHRGERNLASGEGVVMEAEGFPIVRVVSDCNTGTRAI
jgi:hypothetical protein